MIISKTAQRTFRGWEVLGPRIITASFGYKKELTGREGRKKVVNVNIIQVYTPTNDAEEENKDDFYNSLHSVIDKLPDNLQKINQKFFQPEMTSNSYGTTFERGNCCSYNITEFRKEAGPDHIPPEALKADKDTLVEILYALFENLWQEKEIPTDWKEGHRIKLSKKGDLNNCINYKGITLLSIPGKVFNRVLMKRIKLATDEKF
ncbi:uncharacterized protein LOC106011481 [Aplysia californica]|uniref:Uncharacterized protein LOC106011481 n=1 Tax=Aplysia californica TaxID=6500 RepID=A0ABM0ZY07_APLCA|nr:uncharacterized protein LOC106011481 [Aplysia californica]